MDDFILQRIEYADHLIADSVCSKIENGDTILTYARAFVIELALIEAACEQDKHFNLIIVDSRPLFEGKQLMKNIVKALKSHGKCNNISISYTLINSISYVLCKNVNKVFLGASSVLSNGAVVSRVGVANIALMASFYKIPVAVCCETYKFSERVQIDAICSNELGDPDALIKDINSIRADAHNTDPMLNRGIKNSMKHGTNASNMNANIRGSQSPIIGDSGPASARVYGGYLRVLIFENIAFFCFF